VEGRTDEQSGSGFHCLLLDKKTKKTKTIEIPVKRQNLKNIYFFASSS